MLFSLSQCERYLGKLMKELENNLTKISLHIHDPKKLTIQFTPVTHMVYLGIRLHYLDFAC